MAFGIFIHRRDSIYDDTPAVRYQFPAQYLSLAKAVIDDWIIYYEPKKVTKTKGYFAVAKVSDIVEDPTQKDMFFALIEPGSYVDFGDPVPFVKSGVYPETGVLNEKGNVSGRAQAAVRPISDDDFFRILDMGLNETSTILPRSDNELQNVGMAELQRNFVLNPRARVQNLTSRVYRDRNFRKSVLRAYDERCAFSGIKLINGGGRAEVEAAHIRAVESDGPDIVNNGIALSGTCHWMFDRGLVSLSDEHTILVSRQCNDVGSVQSILNDTGKLIGPTHLADAPHPEFLKWHRENVFKH